MKINDLENIEFSRTKQLLADTLIILSKTKEIQKIHIKELYVMNGD